ncbi:MAG: hypothetical protein AAF570_08050 [Bacteroidota bacterium]
MQTHLLEMTGGGRFPTGIAATTRARWEAMFKLVCGTVAGNNSEAGQRSPGCGATP